MREKKVCVMGLGYIGLPSASLLATKGYDVLGVDVNADIVDALNQGLVKIVEPGLDVLVKSAVNSGNLRAAMMPEQADVYMIAVPTPFDQHQNPDISYVLKATEMIAEIMPSGALVIIESTSPVGTSDKVASVLQEHCPGKIFHIAYCPERVIPGRVLHELVENDRVVGGVTEVATEHAVTFYQSFVEGKVLATTARAAEMCKLTENAFRDVNIAFANELSVICNELDIDVWELIRLANHHPRVNILQPGPGVGGHCIAVDPWFIIASAPEQANLIRTARFVNDAKPEWVIQQVQEAARRFTFPKIACLGLSFKPDIDDLRESPALAIVKQMHEMELGELLVVEPFVEALEPFTLYEAKDALRQANIVLVLVDHQVFKSLPRSLFDDKVLIDTKGMIDAPLKVDQKVTAIP